MEHIREALNAVLERAASLTDDQLQAEFDSCRGGAVAYAVKGMWNTPRHIWIVMCSDHEASWPIAAFWDENNAHNHAKSRRLLPNEISCEVMPMRVF